MTNIGNLTVTIGADLKSLDKGIKSATGLIQGAFASAIVKGAYELAQMAEEAEDVGHRVDVVFGDMSGSVKSWSKSFAAATSQNALDVQDLAASVGLAASNMGFGADATDDMAMAVVALGSDMAAFLGQEPEQAINAIESAMKGSGKAMKEYGIVIDDAAVEAEALELGLINVGEAMSQQDKAAASLSLIMEKSNKLTGEAVRQSQDLDAQMRAITSQIKDLSIEIGKVLIPIVGNVVKMFGLAAAGVSKLYAAVNQESLKREFNDAQSSVENYIDILKKIPSMKNNVDFMAKFAKAQERSNKAAEGLNGNAKEFARLEEVVNNVIGDTGDAFNNAKVPADALKNVIGDAKKNANGLASGAKETADELEESRKYAREFADAIERAAKADDDMAFMYSPEVQSQTGMAAPEMEMNSETVLGISSALSSAWSSADVGSAVGTALTAGMGPAGGAMASIISPLVNAFDGSAEEMYTQLEGLFTGLPIALANIFQNLGTLLADLPGMVASAASDPDTWKTLGRVQGAILTGGLSELAKGMINAIKGEDNTTYYSGYEEDKKKYGKDYADYLQAEYVAERNREYESILTGGGGDVSLGAYDAWYQTQVDSLSGGYASGTSSAASGLAWVGERGPELVDFGGGEKVYNHADSMAMAGGFTFAPVIHLSGKATRSDADMLIDAMSKAIKTGQLQNKLAQAGVRFS